MVTHDVKKVTFPHFINFTHLQNHQKQQNAQIIKWKIHQNWSKNSEKRGVSISALKPGPVVPPGIEKTPDQAARISQSVDFGHLSDILAFFRGGSFFDHFWCFSLFWFLTFVTFAFSDFCHFLYFFIFCIFDDFWFCWFLIIFCCFSCWWLFLITFCV